MRTGNSLLPNTVSRQENVWSVLAAAINHHRDMLVTGNRTYFCQF